MLEHAPVDNPASLKAFVFSEKQQARALVLTMFQKLLFSWTYLLSVIASLHSLITFPKEYSTALCVSEAAVLRKEKSFKPNSAI
jgi:hypothetical protein